MVGDAISGGHPSVQEKLLLEHDGCLGGRRVAADLVAPELGGEGGGVVVQVEGVVGEFSRLIDRV